MFIHCVFTILLTNFYIQRDCIPFKVIRYNQLIYNRFGCAATQIAKTPMSSGIIHNNHTFWSRKINSYVFCIAMLYIL